MKSLILFLFLMVASLGHLVAQDAGSITVFAENGERFWLILDGNRINQDAKANVRVEGLKKPWYRSKVIFEDESLEALDNNVGVQDVETNNLMDVTYIVKKTNKGKWVMRVSSFSEVAPAGGESQVLRYDDNSGKVSNQASTTAVESAPKTNVTTTTTTTTTSMGTPQSSGTTDVTINSNIGGITMKANIPNMDMDMNTSMTVTETTQTETTTTSSHPAAPASSPPANKPTGCNMAMSSVDFNSAKASISKQSFSEEQMKVAKQILRSNCLNVNQVIDMMGLFAYEESKLEFVKSAYPKTVDKGNFYKVNDAFTYSSSVDALNEFLESQE